MRHTRSFEHTPDSVPEARHFAREVARGSPPDVVDAIELMVSELVTNCVRHTDSGFDLAIELSTEQIRVEVTDRGRGEPGMRSPRPSDPTGRGLRIVDMLSTNWGHEKRPGGGKTVWFTLTLEAESSTAGAAAARAHPAREEPTPAGERRAVAGPASRRAEHADGHASAELAGFGPARSARPCRHARASQTTARNKRSNHAPISIPHRSERPALSRSNRDHGDGLTE